MVLCRADSGKAVRIGNPFCIVGTFEVLCKEFYVIKKAV